MPVRSARDTQLICQGLKISIKLSNERCNHICHLKENLTINKNNRKIANNTVQYGQFDNGVVHIIKSPKDKRSQIPLCVVLFITVSSQIDTFPISHVLPHSYLTFLISNWYCIWFHSPRTISTQ